MTPASGVRKNWVRLDSLNVKGQLYAALLFLNKGLQRSACPLQLAVRNDPFHIRALLGIH